MVSFSYLFLSLHPFIEAGPNVVSPVERRASENVFLNFRKTSSPFALCKHILETSKVDYVLFESAGLIKDGLIREWASVGKADSAAMRTYLLGYVVNRPALSGYVRERLVQVWFAVGNGGRRLQQDCFVAGDGHHYQETER
jgi:hypothetical protein